MTPEPLPAHKGLIGPNAVLQLLPVLDAHYGRALAARLLAEADLTKLPDGSEMIPETTAARLHQLLRAADAAHASELAAEAGRRTGDYILAHRIPRAAQFVLRLLPARLAAQALSKAIAKHAWTFAGSGGFEVSDPWTFTIARNPMIRGEVSAAPLCHWHAAVFERLYQALVDPACRCQETHCAAQGLGDQCRFRITRGQTMAPVLLSTNAHHRAVLLSD